METEEKLQQALDKLTEKRSGLFFVNSVAKKISLALSLIEAKLDEVDFIVWIAPSNFLSTLSYTNEIKKNNRIFRHRMHFYSIESVSISDEKYLELYNLIHNFRVFCVVDESITIKNTEAGRTQRLLGLSTSFAYRLVLSSIPLTQGLIDLYSQLEFLDPKILRMNENQFNHIFMPFCYNNYLVMKHWSRPEDEARLIEMMKPYVLGYDFGIKFDVVHNNSYFELTSKEQASYDAEKSLFLKDRTQVAFMDVVQNFQRMYTLSKNKLDALQRLVKEILARKEKVIIYIKFLDEITFFKESKFFGDAKFVELTGKSNKRKAIKEFERNADIMFCTYGVDKFGLDMKLCNNIIYFTQTFDYKCKVQSLDTINLKGAPKKMNVYDFWVKTNLEQLINDNLERKKNVLSNICQMITKEEALQL